MDLQRILQIKSINGVWREKLMVSTVVFSHQSDEWETPQDLFDELNKEFNFNFDVAASRENAKCRNFYGKELDGLKQEWEELSIFCNPPYSEISKWVEKAFNECWWAKGIVMLLPARTDTRWFHKYIYKNPDCEIRFIKGRLKFSNSKNSAPFPSMIVIFRI
jgi:phage N-6-adenine-methyltransferase